MSELQKAAEQLENEEHRKREEKYRNATRLSKWQNRRRKVKAYMANMTMDMVQNAGR